MQTGLILLGLIGLVAAIGSIVLPEYYFRTSLFKLLLLLLFLNMALCTIKQAVNYVSRMLNGNRRNSFWFKRAGTTLLHFGIVLVLMGGGINAYYGQNAQISILEGDRVDISRVLQIKQPVYLHLNKFSIDFNRDGTPAQYYSSLDVSGNDKKTKKTNVSVNHPLNYQGIKAYQESFGNLIKVEQNFGDGKSTKALYAEEDIFNVSGSNLQVKVYKYIPNFDPNYGMETKTLRPDNPKIIYAVYNNKTLLDAGTASFGEKIQISAGQYIIFTGVKPYTVLKVKTDPGKPLTSFGGLLLIIGICMALLPEAIGSRAIQDIAVS